MCAIPRLSASIFSSQLWQIGKTEEGKEDGILSFLCPQHSYLTTVAFDKDDTREVLNENEKIYRTRR